MDTTYVYYFKKSDALFFSGISRSVTKETFFFPRYCLAPTVQKSLPLAEQKNQYILIDHQSIGQYPWNFCL